MKELFDDVRDLIAEGALDQAIAQLRDLISSQAGASGAAANQLGGLSNDAVMISGERRNLIRDERRGAVSEQEADRRRRRISADLLSIVDDAERAIDRLSGPKPVASPKVDIAAPDDSKLEKIWGRNTLQSVAWLARGTRAARSVGRVVTPTSYGTGFVLLGGRIVTNHHVIPDPQTAEAYFVEFNFEEDENGLLCAVSRYPLSAEGFVRSEALDCAVAKIVSTSDAPPLESWGCLSVSEQEPVEIGQHVSIIQHPSGGQKKIAVTANEVINIYGHRLHYMTDTLPGSSGAPVFNDDWRVIALHRAGGEMVKNASGERLFTNEGVLMKNILADPELRSVFSSALF